MSRKAVIVTGQRTPFVKSFGELMRVDTIGLSAGAVGGLIKTSGIDPNLVDTLVWGNVVMQTNAPNCAREIVIELNLPKSISCHSTSQACASGLNAISQACQLIEAGHADCVIAGGSDSVSNGEMPLPRKLMYGLAQFVYGKRKGINAIPDFFKEAGYNPGMWLPAMPAVAERSTGKTMGWHADLIAELYKVDRASQDEFAYQSHKKASAARKNGLFDKEISPIDNGKGKLVARDNLIKDDYDVMREKMPKLKPAFRKPDGTITAATSSALTDGASAVLVMSEERAKKLGYPTDIRLKACEFTAVDPYPNLLLAPVVGWPKVLTKAGLKVKDIDLFEIHEAFAGQVLATVKCLESKEFAKQWMNQDTPAIDGKIDMEKVNVNGGSIALGHPFAATGGRIVTSTMNELRRTGKRHGIISICAAGGLGGVGLIERVDVKK